MNIFHTELRQRCRDLWTAGTFPQSVCLVGQRGIGKRTFAHWLTQLMVCARRDGCGDCGACRSIALRHATDVLTLGEGEEIIRIEDVRRLHEHLSQRPLVHPFSIGVLVYVDRATLASQQALLKVLEEPRAYSHLILTARSLEALLPTIRSRVTTFCLAPVPHDQLTHALREFTSSATSERYAQFSRGIPGRLWDTHGALRESLDIEIDFFEQLRAVPAPPFWKVRDLVADYFTRHSTSDDRDVVAQLLSGLWLSGASVSPILDHELIESVLTSAGRNGNREIIIDGMTHALRGLTRHAAVPDHWH